MYLDVSMEFEGESERRVVGPLQLARCDAQKSTLRELRLDELSWCWFWSLCSGDGAAAQQSLMFLPGPYPGLQARLEQGRVSFVFEPLASGIIHGMQ